MGRGGLALLVALGVGFFNGYLVMKTKIPSFLITLGTLLMLTGINLAVTKLISGQVATPERERHGRLGVGAEGVLVVVHIAGVEHPCHGVVVAVVHRVATYVLFKTRIGNSISPSAVIRKVPARSVCR